MDCIKACPFCGSTKISIDTCTYNTICTNCFARGPMFSRVIDKAWELEEKDAAIKAWNTRTDTEETVPADEIFC